MSTTILVALAVIALAVVTLAFLRVLRAERREHKNETALLTNQLLHLSGRPWQPAPADTPMIRDTEDLGYVADPDQLLT